MTASRNGRQKDEEKQVNNNRTKFHLLFRKCGSDREEVWARCGGEVGLRGVVECPDGVGRLFRGAIDDQKGADDYVQFRFPSQEAGLRVSREEKNISWLAIEEGGLSD